MPLAPGDQIGPYLLECLIGVGGMGEVFQATDTRLRRPVALKFLRSDRGADLAQRGRLLQEARAVSGLNHPNIVVVHDIASYQDDDFLVMEYVSGTPLNILIERERLSVSRIAEIGAQIASALGAAHAAGVLHRDIKPGNVIVTDKGAVKVLDFGIAKLLRHDNTQATTLTEVGTIVGTVAYMSPEQTRGEALDGPSDVFALGSLLYHAATGTLPFHGVNALALMHAIATAHAPAPSTIREELPPAFDELVLRCLSKPASHRPTAEEAGTALLQIATQTTSPTIAVTDRQSIAVVPFRLRNATSDDQFLSVALADAVIHRLGSTGKLIVRPLAAVMRYAAAELDWTHVARELNTDLVVEGTIQKIGPKIRVMLQVCRTSDLQVIHSIRQDGGMDDLFGLQDRVSDSVSEKFVPRNRNSPGSATPPTKNQAAYELYLRGIERGSHWTHTDLQSAIELLTRTTEMDPGFADAWAAMAQACHVIRSHYDADLKWLDLGDQAIDRALELNPAHPAALCARAQTLFTAARGFQNRKALRAACAALNVDGSYHNALHWRAVLLFHLGHYAQALRDLDDALRIDPRFVGSLVSKATIVLEMGNAEQSAELYERLLEQEPRMIHAHLFSPLPSIWLGRLDEAHKKIQRTRANYPSEPQITAMEAAVASLRGDFKLAESLADQSVAAGSGTLHLHHAWHCAAGAYAICGKPEKAMTQLRRSAECGLPNYKLFSTDPLLRSLADYGEFYSFLTDLRRDSDSYCEEFGLDRD